jgi:hypothetical protein
MHKRNTSPIVGDNEINKASYCKKENHIRSNAFAKKVTLKGNTMEQYPPPTLYTKKKAATEAKNKTQ